MKRKAHGNREKGKEHTYVAKELFKSAAIYILVHKPIAHKENYGTNYEEAHNIKVVS